MTCFKNNDVIDLYRLHAIHFDTQMFVSAKLGYDGPFD